MSRKIYCAYSCTTEIKTKTQLQRLAEGNVLHHTSI